MAKRKPDCEFHDSCGNKVHYKSAGLCVNCYQAIRYWLKKTPTKVLQRQRKLRLWQTRMESLSNTTVLETRRSSRRRRAA